MKKDNSNTLEAIKALLEIQNDLLIALCGRLIDDNGVEAKQFFDKAYEASYEDDEDDDDDGICSAIDYYEDDYDDDEE